MPSTYSARIAVSSLLFVVICSLPHDILSQSPQSSVEQAVARYLRSEFTGRGRLAIDPNFWTASTGGAGPARDSVRTHDLATVAGGEVLTLQQVLVCPSGAGSCRLRGVDAHIALGRPAILFDSAAVTIVTHRVTGAPGAPVSYDRSEISLVRTDSGWTVVGQVQKTAS